MEGGRKEEGREEGAGEEQKLVSILSLLESVVLQFKSNQVVFGNIQLKLFIVQMGKPRPENGLSWLVGLQISAV